MTVTIRSFGRYWRNGIGYRNTLIRVSPPVTRRDMLKFALAGTPVLAAASDGALVDDVLAPDFGQWDLNL